MEHQETLFKASLSDLVMVARDGWQSCDEQLVEFKKLANVYDAQFIATAIADIDKLEEMSDLAVRNAAVKEARINLHNSYSTARDLWQLLKRYVTKAYAPALIELKLRAAGAAFYTKAVANNKGAMLNLLNAANLFLVDNLTVLKTNGGMPDDFQDKFIIARTESTALSQTFLNMERLKNQDTAAKNAAANAVYTALTHMFADGQRIFKSKKILRKSFVFEQVLLKVRGGGIAGMRGRVIDIETGLPVQGVTIRSFNETYSTITDKDGRYHIRQIAAGTYTFYVSKTGFQQMEKDITIKTGVTSTIDIKLTQIMEMLIAA